MLISFLETLTVNLKTDTQIKEATDFWLPYGPFLNQIPIFGYHGGNTHVGYSDRVQISQFKTELLLEG